MFASLMRTSSRSSRTPVARCFRAPRLQKISLFSTTAADKTWMDEQQDKVAKNMFKCFATEDEGGTHSLKRENVRYMLKAMGTAVSDARLEQLVGIMDTEKNDVISLDEFLVGYKWLVAQSQSTEDLTALFHLIDADSSGDIDIHELKGLMSTTRNNMSNDEAEQIMELANKGGDGLISREEFIDFMTNNKVLGWKLLTSFRVIFITGGPGSGKGTLCEKLTSRIANVIHVSSGDLLRQEVQAKTPLGLEVAAIMESGALVDASVVIALLDKCMADNPGKMLMLDGFPRSLQNAEDFCRLFGPGEGMLVFECPDDEMVRRIVARGATSGRADDNEKTAWNRIKTFREQSEAPLQYFKEQGIDFYPIDACKDPDENVEYILNLPMFKNKVVES